MAGDEIDEQHINEDIPSRITKILNEEGLSYNFAANKLNEAGYNFSYSQLQKMCTSNKVGVGKVIQFLSVFNRYSLEWVFFGTGEMHKHPASKSLDQALKKVAELEKELDRSKKLLEQLNIQDIQDALAVERQNLEYKLLAKENEGLKREVDLLRRLLDEKSK
jgi:hypothetical protein